MNLDLSNISEVCQSHDENALREMAYFRWEHAGRPEGRDEEFWLAAEREMFGLTMGEMAEAYDEYNKEMEKARHTMSSEDWLYHFGC